MVNKYIRSLTYIGILLTPVFGIIEYFNLFPAFSGFIDPSAMMFIKPGKDILLVLIACLFVVDILRGKRFINNLLIWLILTIILLSFAYTFKQISPMLALLGLRVFSPIILIFVAYRYFDFDFFEKIINLLYIIVIIEFILAILHMFFGLHVYGTNLLGYAARLFGTFVKPWSFATFISFVLTLKMGLDIHRYKFIRKKTWIFALITALFVVLSGSGSGLIGLSFILICYFLLYSKVHTYLKAAFASAGVAMQILLLINLPRLTERKIIYESLFTRLNIFKKVAGSLSIKDIFIGKGIGIGSNTAVSFSKLNPTNFDSTDKLFISDSLYTSLLSQVGAIFLLTFLIFTIYLLIKAYKNKFNGINPIALLSLPFLMIVASTNSIFELFPINWMLFIIFGLILKDNKQNNEAKE